MERLTVYREYNTSLGKSIENALERWMANPENRYKEFPKIHAIVPLTLHGTLPAIGRGVSLEVTEVEILFG